MKITKGYKPEEFERLLAVNDECYVGEEKPTLFEFTNMLKHTDVFLAKVNEKDFSHSFPEDLPDENYIIGFAICKPSLMNQRGPYLWSIAVSPSFQGRGVGGNLLREVIKYYTILKGMSEITLHCKPSNPAQKLYFDYGFRVEGVAPHWYGRNELGLFMRRPLP